MELEEEEMDVGTLRKTLGVLQDELATLNANKENVAEIMVMQQMELDWKRRELNERQADMDCWQRDATSTLQATIQLARGQPPVPPAPTSQPDLPQNPHPPQNLRSEHHQCPPNPQDPRNPQRPEQHPAAQQERKPQNHARISEKRQPSHVGRGNTQQHRQNRDEQSPRSPRRQVTDEQNLPSRRQCPSGSRR
ncbi:uncharacterized protein LOC133791688 [Humulus lupulus]|uniref:uncharacterized protein LOC133791688 n=1 Tax=Humulus lupulus TaxID=3486 RepID=UPI002B409EFC|nr:uncharacterized protein LOC133791688 [Humulus lupulus]